MPNDHQENSHTQTSNNNTCKAYDDYLRKLRKWENDVKAKDAELRLQKLKLRETEGLKSSPEQAPKENGCTKLDSVVSKSTTGDLHKSDEEMETTEDDDMSEEEELDAQWKRQKALMAKDKGNALFKEGQYDMAIESYTTGIECDPTNAMLFANRAMAFLRKDMFAAAEEDCTSALAWDPTYIKAYHRRGMARVGLKNYDLAQDDFRRVLSLDRDNKEARQQLEKLDMMESMKKEDLVPVHDHEEKSRRTIPLHSTKSPRVVTIQPISKPEHLRSKKPLKRIQIKEVGTEDYPEDSKPSAKKLTSSSVEASCSLQTSLQPDLPSPASTSYQFLADWKRISRFPEQKYQYLKQIDPAKLPIIFKHSLESELFTDMLKILDKYFIANDLDVYPFLSHLSKVGRFSTLTMLLGNDEMQCLQRLLTYVKESTSEENSLELRKIYRV
ncbi:RNA polymerase II-associated protein 3-like [Ornithodoros turicata]|uniref:RNA polymerase II-associated protein 3-like n=1 Tax=Ornithodoros turicata TaxID=34597 RepID=UPI003138B212